MILHTLMAVWAVLYNSGVHYKFFFICWLRLKAVVSLPIWRTSEIRQNNVYNKNWNWNRQDNHFRTAEWIERFLTVEMMFFYAVVYLGQNERRVMLVNSPNHLGSLIGLTQAVLWDSADCMHGLLLDMNMIGLQIQQGWNQLRGMMCEGIL